MKTLHLSIITIILLSMISAIVPYASAHGVCTGLQPRFGRLDDVAFSKQSVQTGDTITITGNIVSLVQRDLQGQLSIHSSPSAPGRWEIISAEPNGSTIYIPQNSRIPFSVTVKALQPGTYSLSPILYLPEISGPAFVSILDGCNTEPVVTVKGDPICARGLAAILKTEDGSPACVRYTTANALIARGWAKQIVADMKSSEPTVIIPVNSSLMSNGFTFTPSVVKTVVGINSTVQWINMDSVTNDITSNTESFRSGVIESGYAWTHTFDKTGTFDYHSDIHPWLKGTVIVTANPIANLNDTVVTLKTQAYYFTTLNDTLSSYHGVAAIPFAFHGINFTLFPSVFSGGPPGNSTLSCANTNFSSEVKFTDGTYEKLDVHIPGSPCSENYTETVLSNHQNPQAGVQVYQGKIRLLVSTEGQSSFVMLPTSSCDTPYPQSNTDIPVLYMPANSTGQLCVKYFNTGSPFQAGFDIIEARDYNKKAEGTTVSSVPDTVPQGNSTVVYAINSGPKAGFFRMLISCPGMQLAIGYDSNSNFVRGDFPWLDQTFYCGIGHDFQITGTSGIGVKFIPYS